MGCEQRIAEDRAFCSQKETLTPKPKEAGKGTQTIGKSLELFNMVPSSLRQKAEELSCRIFERH